MITEPGTSAKLSKRESQIVTLASEGFTDKEIARNLGIAMGSVRTYWERMRQKTGAKNRAELLAAVHGVRLGSELEEVSSAEQAFRVLFAQTSTPTALVDRKGAFRMLNSAMEKLIQAIGGDPSSYSSAFPQTSLDQLTEEFTVQAGRRLLRIRSGNELRLYQQTTAAICVGDETLLLVHLNEDDGRRAQESS